MKKQNRANDHLTFPSGRSIKDCRADAKILKKKSKNWTTPLSQAQSLNQIAKENGINDTWENALKQIVGENSSDFSRAKAQFNKFSGPIKRQYSVDKRKTMQRFGKSGKLLLPDGQGGIVEVSQHKGRNSGVLITNKVAKMLEADILQTFGGLENMGGYDDGSIELVYALLDPGESNIEQVLEQFCYSRYFIFEFHISREGVVAYFCQSCPWAGFEAVLHVRGHQVTHVGFGTSNAKTAYHWTVFEKLHKYLTPIDIKGRAQFERLAVLQGCFAGQKHAEDTQRRELLGRIYRLLTGHDGQILKADAEPGAVFFELVGDVEDQVLLPLADFLNVAAELGMERHCYIESPIVKQRLMSALSPMPRIECR